MDNDKYKAFVEAMFEETCLAKQDYEHNLAFRGEADEETQSSHARHCILSGLLDCYGFEDEYDAYVRRRG